MKRYCKKCCKEVHEDDMDFDCRSSIGMYGAIVIANIYHSKPCGGLIAEDEIIDNDGNIPPVGKWK